MIEETDLEDLRRMRMRLVRSELLRGRIATWGLMAVAGLVFAYLAYLVLAPSPSSPSWQFVALLGFASLCVAAPLIGRLTFSKDGGAVDLVNPLDRIDQLEAKAREARRESFEQTRQQISGLSQQIQELSTLLTRAAGADDVPANQATGTEILSEPTLRDIRLSLPPITVEDDQQKGRFGGREDDGARRLEARVLRSELGRRWRRVIFTLQSTDGRPLEGIFAYIFLHQSFDPDAYRVQVPPGAHQVAFEIAAEGAFTAGVAAERGATRLEIDLATSPNVVADQDWKER